jgi:redox-sensitive bicupin YhaK (pirin superfamily)
VALWHLALDPGARWTLPPAAGPATRRVLYVFEGSWLSVDGQAVEAGHGALVAPTAALDLAAGDGGAQALLLQDRPIGEPVARYGPFVMNDEAGLRQAFADYQRTRFGGWPWDRDDPVHGPDEPRFARHVDGRVDRRSRTPEPPPAAPLTA